MRDSSITPNQRLSELGTRHGFTPEAVRTMLMALIAGNGSMAQFNHPEFGGLGQWMKGGMVMTSAPDQSDLPKRIDRLCVALVRVLAADPEVSEVGVLRTFPRQTRRWDDRHDAWWPSALGTPSSEGVQNEAAYAYFPTKRKLAVRVNGEVIVYDTREYLVHGFGQQQPGRDLLISTPQGDVPVHSLPVVARLSG